MLLPFSSLLSTLVNFGIAFLVLVFFLYLFGIGASAKNSNINEWNARPNNTGETLDYTTYSKAEIDEIITPTTAPTLTTSYARQSVVETDVVSIPSQFTGAVSYELIGAPATLTITSSTGLISGTITETESFVAYATVAATNSFGTTYAPIVFAVGANAGKSVNSINYDLWATDTSQVGAGKAYNDLLEDYNEPA